MTLPIFRSKNKGFTLIELLVAMVIMIVGLLGLLQAVNVAVSHNLTNQLRDEAVMVAEQQMNAEKSLSFDMIIDGITNAVIQRNVRNYIENYSVNQTVTTMGNTKTINVVVTWQHKGNSYQHMVSTLKSK